MILQGVIMRFLVRLYKFSKCKSRVPGKSIAKHYLVGFEKGCMSLAVEVLLAVHIGFGVSPRGAVDCVTFVARRKVLPLDCESYGVLTASAIVELGISLSRGAGGVNRQRPSDS